ncbi:MAG: SusC/RagA family TonB-linked outer membrane protein [Sphingobacteriaceae bacterium]
MIPTNIKILSKWMGLTSVLLVITTTLIGQTSETITGRVVDSLTAKPLAGVSIAFGDPVQETVTDVDGNFTVQMTMDQELSFRLLGYRSKQILVSENTSLYIAMTPVDEALDEVVVVGYGSQKKANVTGSVKTVDVTTMQEVPISNASRLLQGQSPGVVAKQTTGQPGQEFQVSVRGSSSLGATSDPLYVVDGFPVGTSLGQNLNPSDIQTMTILKDASATAVYGSRGANGVILITTKSAKQDEYRLEVSTNNGMANVPGNRRVDMLNGQQFAQFKKERFEDQIRYFENREPSIDEIPESYRYPEQTKHSTNWFNEILNNNAPFSDYNVSLTNGGKNVNSYISLGYLQQDGALINTNFQRFSGRANMDGRVKNYLKFGLRLSGAYTEQHNGDAQAGMHGNNVVVQSLIMDPREPVYLADGRYNSYIGGQDGVFGFPNPVQRLQEEVHHVFKGTMMANSYLELNLIKDLSFRTSFNAVLDHHRNHDFIPSTIAQFNSPPPLLATGQESFANGLNYGMDNILTYTPQFDDHSFEFTLGHIFQKHTVNTGAAFGEQYPDDLIEYVDAANQRDGSAAQTAFSLVSYLSRINYAYRNKYLLGASFNREASSRFGRNNRWGNFPSFSLGWRLSDEEFFPTPAWLNDFKIRGSYGVTGNNNIGNYTSAATMAISNYVFGSSVVPGAIIGAFANRNLGWERSTQINAGVDLAIWNNKIGFSAEIYQKTTDDMLLNVDVPSVAGFSSVITNVGEVRNKGLELDASYRDNRNDFTWGTSFNMSFNRNKILSIDGNRDELLTGDFYDGYNISQVGSPVGLFYGFDVLGIYQTQAEIDATPHNENHIPGTYQYRDGNGDGKISYDMQDMVVIGNPHPNFTWGWNVNLGYKRFDLSVMMNGAQGGQLYRHIEIATTNIDGVFNVSQEVQDRWRSPETPGKGKQAGSNTYYFTRESNSRFVYDGSYAWIKNMTLSYKTPRIRDLFDARVFISVDNAFLLTKYPGNNPEVDAARTENSSDIISPGKDREAYPVPRTFSIGTRINF